MKTILPAMEDAAQLWGYPKPKDKVYRLMKYILQVDVEDGLLLHNCVTRQLIHLSKEEAEQLSGLPAQPSETMQGLIENHFLVPEDFDEFKSVNQLRKICQARQTSDVINRYIILPTTFCNARCFYCYESDYPHVHMTEETASKLIEYIAEHRKDKTVRLSWFGGEPLVGIARIDQISQGLKDRDIPFTASMISNGYLFDEEIIERSVKLWNLKKVQITLDGTEEVYNRVKAYVNPKDNPFEHVLKNIDLLSKKGVHVNIRLNVDFYNKDDILTLIEDLGKRYSGNEHIAVYLNMLFNDQGFDPVHHSQDEMVHLHYLIDEYTDRLKELKLGYERRKIPYLQVEQCMADDPHSVEIQPDGSFCRCEHENVNDSYGNMDEGILDPQKPLTWRKTIQQTDYCPECPFYPSCYLLEKCMNSQFPCVESLRLNSQKHICENLRSIYYQKMEDEKDEEVHGS